MKNLDDHNRRPLNYQSKKKHSSKYSDDPEKIARKVAVHFTRLDSNDVMRNAYLIKMYTRYGHFLSSAVRLLCLTALLRFLHQSYTLDSVNGLKTTMSYQKNNLDFEKNRCATDGVFILNTLIEKSHTARVPLFVCCVDFKKAFDSVQHRKNSIL